MSLLPFLRPLARQARFYKNFAFTYVLRCLFLFFSSSFSTSISLRYFINSRFDFLQKVITFFNLKNYIHFVWNFDELKLLKFSKYQSILLFLIISTRQNINTINYQI